MQLPRASLCTGQRERSLATLQNGNWWLWLGGLFLNTVWSLETATVVCGIIRWLVFISCDEPLKSRTQASVALPWPKECFEEQIQHLCISLLELGAEIFPKTREGTYSELPTSWQAFSVQLFRARPPTLEEVATGCSGCKKYLLWVAHDHSKNDCVFSPGHP